MKRAIWVVMGRTGEYSDSTDWLVCAYENEAAAHRHADRAMVRARELMDSGDQADDIRWDEARLREWMGDLDPVGSRMDYTGSDYVALPVEVRRG